jgi:hypothetical protein
MRRTLVLVVVLSLFALTLSACATPAVEPQPAPAPPPPGASKKAGDLVAGIEDLGGGRVVASGWVYYVDLETGFWAVSSTAPQESHQPEVVAVLLPGKVTAAELENVKGTFVGAEGVLQEGASIRMAGPEIVVDALRVY